LLGREDLILIGIVFHPETRYWLAEMWNGTGVVTTSQGVKEILGWEM